MVPPKLIRVIPVDINKLGPRLQALDNIKSAATSLRLCKRYGQGPAQSPAPTITRFPNELIEMVINEMLAVEEDVQEKCWRQMQICGRHCYHWGPGDKRIEINCMMTVYSPRQSISIWDAMDKEIIQKGGYRVDKVMRANLGLSVQLTELGLWNRYPFPEVVGPDPRKLALCYDIT